MMSSITDNLPILAELSILLIAIGFAFHQIRLMNRLKREREEKEAAEKATKGANKPNASGR